VLDFAPRITPEELKRMNELVLLIQGEQDQLKFGNLVDELNALLDERELRFPAPPTQKSTKMTVRALVQP